MQVLGRGDIGGKLALLGNQRKEKVFGKRQVIPEGGVDYLADAGLGAQGHHPVGQQIQGDQRPGAGIVELVLEFAV